MNIVIPHQNHSSTQHLRYALRSIAEHHPDANVSLVGDKPVWVDNVKHIPHKDDTGLVWKERNIYRKMRAVPYASWWCMHDDHYLLQPLGRTKYQKKVGTYGGHYSTTMQNTWAITGLVDFDTHFPFHVSRDRFEVLNGLDWNKPYGYAIQTVYCSLNDIKGKMVEDVKIRTAMSRGAILEAIAGKPSFSSSDISFQGEMRSVLITLFPNKCKFEA